MYQESDKNAQEEDGGGGDGGMGNTSAGIAGINGDPPGPAYLFRKPKRVKVESKTWGDILTMNGKITRASEMKLPDEAIAAIADSGRVIIEYEGQELVINGTPITDR
jgi:hypothetical protein